VTSASAPYLGCVSTDGGGWGELRLQHDLQKFKINKCAHPMNWELEFDVAALASLLGGASIPMRVVGRS
jgi:hypothetical protein